MYLSKRKKTVLAWAIPTAIVVTAAVVVTPIIVFNENNKWDVLTSAPEMEVLPFNELSNYSSDDNNDNSETTYVNPLARASLNPSNFDINYFVYKICSNPKTLNEAFGFLDLEKNSETGFYETYSNLVYKVASANIQMDENNKFLVIDNSYVFDVQVEISYKGKSRTYSQQNISIPVSAFSDDATSRDSFLIQSAQEINNLLSGQSLTFALANDSISSIGQITDPSDLKINASTNSALAQSFVKKGTGADTYYQSTDSSLIYLPGNSDQNIIELTTPISDGSTRLVLESSQAYSFNDDSTFDTSSDLFTFLKSAYQSNNLVYLPELTAEESSDLSDDQKIDRQIQKLIFDSNSQVPSELDANGNKVPSSSYQAIVVKVQFGDSFTYLVSWSNIFTLDEQQIVDSAPELPMKILASQSGALSWEQITKPENYGFIVTSGQANANLTYKATNVKFDSSDTYKTTAIVTVTVSSLANPSISKTYETKITTGFNSAAYITLDSQIQSLIGTSQDLSSIAPKVKVKTTNEEVYKNLYDYQNLEQQLTIEAPEGLSNVKYTIASARMDGNTMILAFKISSSNDTNNYWTLNNQVQTVSVALENIISS